jgi:hypothetical protein
MAAIRKGPHPNFHEAFTQLHLGQLIASFKCVSRDRCNGRIDSNTDQISMDSVYSPRPRVDEDLGISSITGHDIINQYEIGRLLLPRCRYVVVEEDLGHEVVLNLIIEMGGKKSV